MSTKAFIIFTALTSFSNITYASSHSLDSSICQQTHPRHVVSTSEDSKSKEEKVIKKADNTNWPPHHQGSLSDR